MVVFDFKDHHGSLIFKRHYDYYHILSLKDESFVIALYRKNTLKYDIIKLRHDDHFRILKSISYQDSVHAYIPVLDGCFVHDLDLGEISLIGNNVIGYAFAKNFQAYYHTNSDIIAKILRFAYHIDRFESNSLLLISKTERKIIVLPEFSQASSVMLGFSYDESKLLMMYLLGVNRVMQAIILDNPLYE